MNTKMLIIGGGLLIAGILFFALASGNEILTFLGFATFYPGLLVLVWALLKHFIEKKLLFWPIFAVSAILLLFLSIFAFLTFFFPNETVRQVMEKEMSSALARKVTLQELNVSLLEGISLRKLHISEMDDPEKTFVKAESLLLSYQILPLLTGRLVVSSAVLENAEIQVRRYLRKGQAVTTIDDLLAPAPEQQAFRHGVHVAPPPKKETSGASNADAASGSPLPDIPLAINIDEMGLREATIVFSDTASSGFENRYTLDRVSCMVEDFNWPAYQPLELTVRFRMKLDRLNAEGEKTGESFSLMPELDGTLTLLAKNGTLEPHGELIFQASEGFFNGLQFQERANAFLTELKQRFFKGISSAVQKKMDLFDNLLKAKLATFDDVSERRIDKTIEDAEKDYKKERAQLLEKKKQLKENFEDRLDHNQDAMEDKADSLLSGFAKAKKSAAKIAPESSVDFSQYKKQADAAAAKARKSYKRTSRSLASALPGKLDAVIARQKKAFENFRSSLKNEFSKTITAYSQKLRQDFKDKLADVARAASAYKLDLPFLSKKIQFSDLQSTLDIEEGTVAFTNMNIDGDGFQVKAAGKYHLLNGDYRLNCGLAVEKEYKKGTLTSLFVGKNGRFNLEFVLSSRDGTISYSLEGPPIAERLRGQAEELAGSYIKNYLAENVSMDALIRALPGQADGAKPWEGGGKAMDAAYNRQKRSLDNALQKQEDALTRKIASIRKAYLDRVKQEAKDEAGSRAEDLLENRNPF